MLIWLNGPHGVGKTQAAFELHRRIPGSFVCDPEHLSIGLSRMLPDGMGSDARVRALWRHAVSDVLAMVLDQRGGRGGRAGPVIAPKTVFDPGALRAIIDPLRAAGHEVHHVTLLASRDVVLRRMRSRLESPRGSRIWIPTRQSGCAALRTPGCEQRRNGSARSKSGRQAGCPGGRLRMC
jgi:hypothetical protein